MKRFIKIALLILAIAFIGIQFFQIDKTNPPVVEGQTLESAVAVPADIAFVLGRACNDCHTNKTNYPWYSYIQPSGWFLKDHVNEGRRELNFSEFAAYEPRKRKKKLEEICEQVESGEMPLPSYLWIHRESVLSESDKKAICDWSKSVAGSQ